MTVCLRISILLLCSIVLSLAAFSTAPSVTAAPAARELVSAADARAGHVWLALPARMGSLEYRLCHHTGQIGPHFRSLVRLNQKPAAMAAWENRVWLVMERNEENSQPRREVYTITAEFNDVLGVYDGVPSERLDLMPPLPANGRLASFIGNANGPLALIADHQASNRLQLLQLRHDRWVEIEPPSEVQASNWRMLAQRNEGESFTILTTANDESNNIFRFELDADDQWQKSEVDLDWRQIRTLVHGNGQLAAVRLHADGMVSINYVRNQSMIELTQFDVPESDWSVVALPGEFGVFESSYEGRVTKRSVNFLNGQMSEATELTQQPISTATLWQWSIIIAVGVGCVLLAVLVKPTRASEIALPKGVAPLPLSARAVAFLIDLAPSALVATLVLDAEVNDLVLMPMFTAQLAQQMPYLLMAGVTVTHSMIAELIWGRTLGKMVMGGRAARLDGKRISARQALCRNAVKALVLIVPPLAVVALLSPYLQGLADLAAGTLVVRDEAESQT